MKNLAELEAIATSDLSGVSGGMQLNAEFLRQIQGSTDRFNSDRGLQKLVKRERKHGLR